MICCGQIMTLDDHPARRRAFDAAQHVEQGRFAGTGRPKHHEELGATDLQPDISQGVHRALTRAVRALHPRQRCQRRRPATLASLTGVERTYGSGESAVHALRDVGLEIGRAEPLVVLGPSGSGKTTLLNVLGGIERPTAGRVVVEGHDLTTADSHSLTLIRRDVVGFVFQFFNLISSLTARENVAVLAELTGHDQPGRVDAVLSDVGLTDLAEYFPSQVSGCLLYTSDAA